MELTPDQSDELKRSLPNCVARASSLISEADVLLFSTGAGWSADSGLPTYEQTPDYANVCKPAMLRETETGAADTFKEFWAACHDRYRDTAPHEGFAIVTQWQQGRFSQNGMSFFALTSNVDGHAQRTFASTRATAPPITGSASGPTAPQSRPMLDSFAEPAATWATGSLPPPPPPPPLSPSAGRCLRTRGSLDRSG